MSDDHIERLTHRFTDEQPYLVSFLLSTFEDQLLQDEQEWLFLSGMMLWYAVILQEDRLPTIPEKLIDQYEKANEPLFKYLDTETEESWEESVETILEGYPQDMLLAAGTDVLLDDEESDIPLTQESKTLLFVALKTFTDALVQAEG